MLSFLKMYQGFSWSTSALRPPTSQQSLLCWTAATLAFPSAYLPIQQLSAQSFQVKVGVFSPHLDSWMLSGRRWRRGEDDGTSKIALGKSNLALTYCVHDWFMILEVGGVWSNCHQMASFQIPLLSLSGKKKKSLLMMTTEAAFLLYTVASSLQAVTLGRPLWRYSP